MIKSRFGAGAIAVIGFLCAAWGIANAEPTCDQPIGEFVSIQGTILLNESPAVFQEEICYKDSIVVGENSRAAVYLYDNRTVLRLDQNTEFHIHPPIEKRSLLQIIKGTINFLSRTPGVLTIKTPFVNGDVEGTEFEVVVDIINEETRLNVFEGSVVLENAAGRTPVGSNQSAVATAPATTPPKIVGVVNLNDSVAWSLYYLPLLPDSVPSNLKEAGEVILGSEPWRALDILRSVPDSERNASYYSLMAGLYLSVGRIDESRAALDKLNPNNGYRMALESIIALSQNDAKKALNKARQAVSQDPFSAAAHTALSFAHQGSFQLEEALNNAKIAMDLDQQNAFIAARVAELQLSLGNLKRATATAELAVSLKQNASRTHTILGFALLTRARTMRAVEAFQRAIEQDSADPLPRLGLGLAMIRKSDLEGGRREIEIAAGLDPRNALIRSYLGKAYYEEKRIPLDIAQFAIAKLLDPNDPTSFFYDAIRAQSVNQPLIALRDLQTASELNNNRAVYRSRFLLVEDLAAPGAPQRQVYSEVGFEQLALVNGWESVDRAPGNHSGHRLLADTYSTLPRHAIARDSELLQSQLLQPININPVQPRLAGNGLDFLNDTGPADVGFNEFNRLFARNEVRLQIDGLAGSNNTWTDNLIVSGIHEQLSYSLGQFHYETDGVRENNDLEQDIYNLFLQWDAVPSTSVQIELRSNKEELGDEALLFFPDNFSPSFREMFETRTARVGLRHRFSPSAILLASYIDGEAKDDFQPFPALSVLNEADTHQFELRHIQDGQSGGFTLGIGSLDNEEDETVTFAGTPPDRAITKTGHDNVYTYFYLYPLERLTLTLGLSADRFDTLELYREQTNPKLGINWTAGPKTTFRAAAFRTLKRTVVSSQTLEPTHVAGFNQFFDDANGADAWRYGLALDHMFGLQNYVGIEVSRREVKQPVIQLPERITQDFEQDEDLVRAYYYRALSSYVAVNVEYRYERFRGEPGGPGTLDSETHRLPGEIRFFHPNGLFLGGRATLVDQQGLFDTADGELVQGSDRFVVVGASIGYRFKKRRGLASVEIRNLFNEDFNFQDTDPTNSTIATERTVLGRLTLSF